MSTLDTKQFHNYHLTLITYRNNIYEKENQC